MLNTAPVTYISNPIALIAIRLWIKNFCEALLVKTETIGASSLIHFLAVGNFAVFWFFSGFSWSWWLLCLGFQYNHNVAWLPMSLQRQLTKGGGLGKFMQSDNQDKFCSLLSSSATPLYVILGIIPYWPQCSRVLDLGSVFQQLFLFGKKDKIIYLAILKSFQNCLRLIKKTQKNFWTNPYFGIFKVNVFISLSKMTVS